MLVTPFLFCVIVCACEGCAPCLMGEKKKGVCEMIRGPPNNADIPDFFKNRSVVFLPPFTPGNNVDFTYGDDKPTLFPGVKGGKKENNAG